MDKVSAKQVADIATKFRCIALTDDEAVDVAREVAAVKGMKFEVLKKFDAEKLVENTVYFVDASKLTDTDIKQAHEYVVVRDKPIWHNVIIVFANTQPQTILPMSLLNRMVHINNA